MKYVAAKKNLQFAARNIIKTISKVIGMRCAAVLVLALSLFSNLAARADDGCTGVPLTDRAYFQTFANKGDPEGQYEVGKILDHDRASRGADIRSSEATEYFRKAAEQGHVEAQHALCVGYTWLWTRNPSMKSTPDDDAQWCRKAAEQGHHNAQGILGALYYKGQGVPQSYEEAYFWFTLAGTYSVRQKETEKFLSIEQISSVQRRVKSWVPTTPPPKAPIPLNIAGLICGGQVSNCKIVDNCGDLLAIICPNRKKPYILADKTTKSIISSCPSKGIFSIEESCDNFLPMKWTCGYPKGMHLP